MLKRTVISLLVLLSFAVMAQSESALKFGHYNSHEILLQMSETESAQKQLSALSSSYDKELSKMSQDYDAKVEDFVKYSKDMDEEIKKSRQHEIVSLEERIVALKETANATLRKKQEELLLPIKEKLQNAVKQIGEEHHFMYLFDTNIPSLGYISPESEDVTPLIKSKLDLK